MLMKRRSLPPSSLICVLRAGKLWSMSAIRPGRFSAAESNCLRPSVWRTKAVGSTTLILIGMRPSCGHQLWFGGAIELAQILIEVGETRTYGALRLVLVAEGVRCFEAVAGDADNGRLVRRDAAVSVKSGGDGGGDA